MKKLFLSAVGVGFLLNLDAAQYTDMGPQGQTYSVGVYTYPSSGTYYNSSTPSNQVYYSDQYGPYYSTYGAPQVQSSQGFYGSQGYVAPRRQSFYGNQRYYQGGSYQSNPQGLIYPENQPNYEGGYNRGNPNYYRSVNQNYYQGAYQQDGSMTPNQYRDQSYSFTPQGQMQGQFDSSTSLNDEDQRLRKKVQDALAGGWFSKKYDQVQAFVTNGNVTLSGSVPTWDDKNDIDKKIRSMNGVRNLDNQISIMDTSTDSSTFGNRSMYTRSSDDSSSNRTMNARSSDREMNKFPQDRFATQRDLQLNRDIRKKISEGWFSTKYDDLRLNTNNGTVILEGTVDSQDDERKILNDIQKIQGVRSVVSRLQIDNR